MKKPVVQVSALYCPVAKSISQVAVFALHFWHLPSPLNVPSGQVAAQVPSDCANIPGALQSKQKFAAPLHSVQSVWHGVHVLESRFFIVVGTSAGTSGTLLLNIPDGQRLTHVLIPVMSVRSENFGY